MFFQGFIFQSIANKHLVAVFMMHQLNKIKAELPRFLTLLSEIKLIHDRLLLVDNANEAS